MGICGSLMNIFDYPKREAQIKYLFLTPPNREAQINIFMTAIQSLLP